MSDQLEDEAEQPREVQITHLNFDATTGKTEIGAIMPNVSILAAECGALLEQHEAKNYVEFDMIPRAESGVQGYRVTVQRLLGKSPAQRVIEMEKQVAQLQAAVKASANRPVIVCLCGSTRFYEAFVAANFHETMAGKIVLSVGFFLHRPEMIPIHGEAVGITSEEKVMLDELHLRKIDLADEVLFLNVGGYIGESTRRELAYAREQGKVIRFLENPNATA
jgi:cell division protein FtsB